MASEEPPATTSTSASAESTSSSSTPATAEASTPTASEATTAAPAAATDAAPATAEGSTAAAPAKKKVLRRIAGKNYDADPALYIFTSLTAGNMHIVTATSRLETILRANRVPFKATDLSTDQRARVLWGRRAGKTAEGKPRRLPALVQTGDVLGVCCESVLLLRPDKSGVTNSPLPSRTSPRSKNGTNTANSSSTSRFTSTSSRNPRRAPWRPCPSTSNP